MAEPCRFEDVRDGARTVIRLSGTFDRGSAIELGERLEGAAGGELVLDFSHVREFADLGVATLAHALVGGQRRLLLRGLRQHQLRIFRYFGIDVESLQGEASL